MSMERVLVVDDDEALVHLMSLALRRRGYQVEHALDGFAALSTIAAQPPFSVLLTDLMMPGMSGLELLREARKQDSRLEVVVITAAPDLDSAVSAMRADGAYDYLLKPFESMSQLLMAVERAATQRRLLIEREELRVQVQNEAQRLRAFVTNTGDAILSADAGGVLRIVNPAAARLIGVEQMEGMPALEALPPALSRLITNWLAVSEGLPATVEIAWADGSVQMVNLTSVPEENDARGWVAVLRDITHLQQMEEVKTQMLNEAASRIRIPLAQAMNALVELNILTTQNERVSEVVFRLTNIWKRIQEWGDDLNALTNINTAATLPSNRISLASLLKEIEQSRAASEYPSASVQMEITLEPDIPQVYADTELLRRLFNGLVNRALARSQPGSSIRVYARYFNNQVWVSVSDDGPAVSDNDLPRIFEKSFAKTGAAGGATGLEMAMVKSIMDRMGGQVWIGGQERKGSTIYVCLPVLDAAS